jgi:hypothetical protein
MAILLVLPHQHMAYDQIEYQCHASSPYKIMVSILSFQKRKDAYTHHMIANVFLPGHLIDDWLSTLRRRGTATSRKQSRGIYTQPLAVMEACPNREMMMHESGREVVEERDDKRCVARDCRSHHAHRIQPRRAL